MLNDSNIVFEELTLFLTLLERIVEKSKAKKGYFSRNFLKSSLSIIRISVDSIDLVVTECLSSVKREGFRQ